MKKRLLQELIAGLIASKGKKAFLPTNIANLSAWYDPSAETTLFSDFEGTQAGVGDAVALMLDRSQGAALGADGATAFNDTVWAAIGAGSIDGGDTFSVSGGAGGIQNDELLADDTAYLVEGTFSKSSGNEFSIRTTGGSGLTLFASTATSGSFSVYIMPFGDNQNLYFRLANTDTCTVNYTIKTIAGNHAHQFTSGSRPVLREDAGGRRHLEPDGSDDYMELPVSTIDYTGSISVWSGYSIDTANSDSNSVVLAGDDGASVASFAMAHGTSNRPRNFVTESGTASTAELIYVTSPTDNEPMVRADVWADGASQTIRIAGRDVTSNSTAFAALDAATNLNLFGKDTGQSMAGRYYGMAIYNGLLTDAEKTSIDLYYATKIGDTGMAKSLEQNMLDFFAADTSNDVTDDFSSYADTAALTAVWSDVSTGGGSVKLDAANDEMDVKGTGGGATGIARRDFKVTVGRRYTVSTTRTADGSGAGALKVGTTAGGTDLASESTSAGGTTTATFVATTDTCYVDIESETNGNTHSFSSAAIAGTATKGAMWDFTDFDNMGTSTDGTGTVTASSAVAYVGDKSGNGYHLQQSTAGSRPVAANDADGNSLDFDGSDDYFVALDPDDDLVITGDLFLAAVGKTNNSSSARVIVATGDSTTNRNNAYQYYLSTTSNDHSFQQSDASNNEAENSTTTRPTDDVTSLMEAKRDGTTVSVWLDEDSTDDLIFSVVTSPTAGSSPITHVGIDVDGSNAPWDGHMQAVLLANRHPTLTEQVRLRHYLDSLTEADVT